MEEHSNDWEKWSVFVLKELERLNACYKSLDSKCNKIANEIASLKTEVRVKGGVWGAIGGMAVSYTHLTLPTN